MKLFTHKYETPKEQREVPGTGTRSDRIIFEKERAASLENTREAMAEYEKQKAQAQAQGEIAMIGAAVEPAPVQIDPSHEITAHAQEQDMARAIAEADVADKVASGHLTTV